MPQAGIELIGRDSPAADAEIVLVGAEALAAVGLARPSFDLTLPTLTPALMDAAGIEAGAARRLWPARSTARTPRRWRAMAGARPGADRSAARRRSGGSRAGRAGRRGPAAGRPRAGVNAWPTRSPPSAPARPALRLTIDPVEFRGFRYHTGVSPSPSIAPGRHEEARPWRALCLRRTDPATGLTLYPDALLRAAPPARPRARGCSCRSARTPIGGALPGRVGYATVAGLDPAGDPDRRGAPPALHASAAQWRAAAAVRSLNLGETQWPMSP